MSIKEKNWALEKQYHCRMKRCCLSKAQCCFKAVSCVSSSAYHSLGRHRGLHTASQTLSLRLICSQDTQAGGDLANPFPKPFSSPAGTETLRICSFHGNYKNLLPFIVLLFLTMEQSHDFNRKNNAGIGDHLD